MSGLRGEPLMLGFAFRIQAKRYCDSLKQRRFTGAVLPDEERYGCCEPQLGEVANGGYRIGIVSRRDAEYALSGNGLDEDSRQRGRELGAAFFHFSLDANAAGSRVS